MLTCPPTAYCLPSGPTLKFRTIPLRAYAPAADKCACSCRRTAPSVFFRSATSSCCDFVSGLPCASTAAEELGPWLAFLELAWVLAEVLLLLLPLLLLPLVPLEDELLEHDEQLQLAPCLEDAEDADE